MMGIAKTFYLFSRKLKEEARYNDEGRREGITKIYYRNGQLKKEVLYHNGRKEGPARRFFKDGSRFEFECTGGRERAGRWRNYDRAGVLIMERIHSRTGDVICELYYEYEEYGRTITVQWTKFLDDEVEKYRQRASEYDVRGDPGFPVSERNKYPAVGTPSHF